MKTKTINLYSYDELSKEAQEKAFKQWRENNDYIFLSDDMNERLHELLEENKIKDVNGEYDTVNHVRPKGKAKVLYSLTYCQGDGAMFTGSFEWNGYEIIIKQSGHYYHSYSKTIEMTPEGADYNIAEEAEAYKEFEKIYQSICQQLEEYGYKIIDGEDSNERFVEECEANEWTFTSDGTLES